MKREAVVGVFGFRLPLKVSGETRVEIEDLGTEYEFVFGLDLVGFGLLHAGPGVVVVEGRRAARGVFLGFVPEGDLCGIERFFRRTVFQQGGIGLVVGRFDLFCRVCSASVRASCWLRTPSLAVRTLLRVAMRLKMGMLIATPTYSVLLLRNWRPKAGFTAPVANE